MGFWDEVKTFFGIGPEEGPPASGLEAHVRAAIVERIRTQRTFSAVHIADDVRGRHPGVDTSAVAAWVEELHRRGHLASRGYSRTLQRTGDRMVWLYHAVGRPPAPAPSHQPAYAPPASSSSVFSSLSGPTPKKTKRKKERDPYEAGELMSLSPAELRARAMKVVPWRTAWIGRVDVIPPASDERTGLVDRGLVLRGFFTEEEIEEIHRVGDLWLEHRESYKLARLAAVKTADEAIQRLRREAIERKERKKAEAAERKKERAAAVAKRKATDIVFLGRGVSGRLGDRRANVERLEQQGLPVLAAPADLARAMDLAIPKLRWLTFHAEASSGGHYVQFEIPKRSGGKRTLSAPKAELRSAQSWVLAEILAKLPTEEAAHGFVSGRSTVTNARAHQAKDVVVNLDLERFFPTITFPRVRGLYASLGYSPAVATILALLTTEAPRRDVKYAGARYRVAVGPRSLPQGACTSPALSNQVARKLDRRLAGLAKKHGWAYTRYADDLTFSAPAGKREELGLLLARVRHVVEDEGFRINEKKGRVQRKGGRQTVCGIVVNEADKLRLPRDELRQLRAILHNAKKTGLAAQNRGGHPHFEAYLRGKIAYVSMVDPDRGADLAQRLAELR